MNTKYYKEIKKVLFLVIISSILIFTFLSKIQCQNNSSGKPLSLVQIQELIKVFPDEAISLEIQKRSIEFQVTEDILNNLKNIGAGAKTLDALVKIKNIQSSTPNNKHTNQITILIAKFADQNNSNDEITDLITNQLQELTRKYPNISILSLGEHISAQQGRSVAIEKGKAKNADIVLWGGFKKSSTNVIVNYQIEMLTNPSSDLLPITARTSVEEIPNFNNFSSQLRLSKEISLLTLVSLGLINFQLENYDDSIKYISDVISQEPSNKVIDLSKLYILRATSYLKRSCGFLIAGQDSLTDVNKAISLGADINNPQILRILTSANIEKNLEKSLLYAEKYYQNATDDEDKNISLLLLMLIYAKKGDEVQTINFARKLTDRLLVLPENIDNYIFSSIASLVLQDKVKTALYLDKAKNSSNINNSQLYLIFYIQGSLYASDNNYDLAVEDFKKSIQLNRNCILAYQALGDVYKDKEDFDSALNIYNQGLEINSSFSDIYVSKGEIYEEREDFERALANYQKAVEVESSSVEAYRSLASFYKNRNKINEAIDTFSKLLAINKDDEESLKERAELYLKAKKIDLAVVDYKNLFPQLAKKSDELSKLTLKSLFHGLIAELFRRDYNDLGVEISDQYIQLFPKDSVGYEEKADFLISKGNIDLAIENLTQAIRLNGNKSSNYEKRASLWQQKNALDKALEDLDQTVRLDPQNEDAREQRAKLYLQINKFDSAIEEFKSLIKLKAEKKTKLGNLEASILFGKIISEIKKQKKYQLGIEFANQYIQLFPDDDGGFEVLGDFLEATGNIDGAIEAISKAIKIKSLPAYYESRAALWNKKGNIDNQLKDITQAIMLSNDARILEKRAGLYLRIEKFDLAIADYKELLKLKAKNKTDLDILTAHVLLRNIEEETKKRNKYELGIDFASEYILLFANDDAGYQTRATFYNESGNFSKALEDINQAVKLNPTNANSYSIMSKIYEKNGNINLAIESLQKAIKVSRDDEKWLYEGLLESLQLRNK